MANDLTATVIISPPGFYITKDGEIIFEYVPHCHPDSVVLANKYFEETKTKYRELGFTIKEEVKNNETM